MSIISTIVRAIGLVLNAVGLVHPPAGLVGGETSAEDGDYSHEQIGGIDGIIDLNTTREKQQGYKPWCAAYSSLDCVETMLRAKYKELFNMDYKRLGRDLVAAGIITEKGAWIYKVMDWMHENGVYDLSGNHYKVGKRKQIKRDEIVQYMDKGHPVVMGGYVGRPYYDKLFCWIPRTARDGSGHAELFTMYYPRRLALLLLGIDESVYGKKTSWGLFGWLRRKAPMGITWVRESDLGKIFTPQIFESVEKDIPNENQ